MPHERPIDRLALGPTREITHNSDGSVSIKVTPPKWANVGDGCVVELTADQYVRYQQWREGAMINDVLSDLSADTRERLMTGITDFDTRFPASEEDD